eukprot:2851110-Rhodomonas_salina.2
MDLMMMMMMPVMMMMMPGPVMMMMIKATSSANKAWFSTPPLHVPFSLGVDHSVYLPSPRSMSECPTHDDDEGNRPVCRNKCKPQTSFLV